MNYLEKFEEHNLQLFKDMRAVTQIKKEAEVKEKEIKAELEKAMAQYDIKSIDNEYIKITRSSDSVTKSIDLKKLQDEEPRLYGELLEDYPKITTRRGGLRFTIK